MFVPRFVFALMVALLAAACGPDRDNGGRHTSLGGPAPWCSCPPPGTTVTCCHANGTPPPTQPRCECLDEVEDLCPGVTVARSGSSADSVDLCR